MFVDNGNGTYGVRFFVNGDEIWETVNDELPAATELFKTRTTPTS